MSKNLPNDVTARLGFVIRAAQAAVWRDLVASFAPYSLKPQHFAVLDLLESHPGCRLEFLAHNLAIRPPNLVPMVEELVARGYILREVTAQDRRAHALSLTDAGGAMLGELKKADDAHLRRMADLVGSDRMEPLLQSLKALAADNKKPAVDAGPNP